MRALETMHYLILQYTAMLNNELFLDPSPKPSVANLFKQGGPCSNASSTFVSFTVICSISSLVCAHSSYID